MAQTRKPTPAAQEAAQAAEEAVSLAYEIDLDDGDEVLDEDVSATPDGQTYDALRARFESTHRDTRGGATFDYITGEQCISRLNAVLGPFGWSFVVRAHGINEEADEAWALGTLTILRDGNGMVLEPPVVHEQFGSQKIKRKRDGSGILEIGFDLKGATTDAMKKCATQVGVALYLASKEKNPEESAAPQTPAVQPRTAQAQQQDGTVQSTATASEGSPKPAALPTPISSAASAKPMPGRAINRGVPKGLKKEDWDKFYVACSEHLGLDTISKVTQPFPGNIVDVGQLLAAYNTDLQGLYLLLQWLQTGTAEEPHPVPPYVVALATGKASR